MDTLPSNKEQLIFEDLKKEFLNDAEITFAGTLLSKAARKYPLNTALISQDTSLTFKELYFRSILLSKQLALHGVCPHDKVILLFENSAEFYIAYFATWQLGAVVVPVNTFLHEKELGYIITESEPKVIIASSSLGQKLQNVLLGGYTTTLPTLLGPDAFDRQTYTEDCINQTIQDFTIHELAQDDLCALLYTSGTTGTPKGVMLSSRNIITNALQGFARFRTYGMTNQERFFCILPLFHVFAQNACLWLPIMIGSTVILVNKIDRKLILEGLKHKPTLFFGFPALYGLLCLMKTAPLDSIKMFVSGADMLPDKIRLGFALIYGRKIASGYGLSEASPFVAVNHENNTKATSVVGKMFVGIDHQIRDDEGSVVEQGTIGTLWLKGDNIMMGYYNAPESTKSVLSDGWLNTGDRAFIDHDGTLAICGRTKDIIIHKGFNIYPAEVENVLLKHPAVFKAAVIGQDEAMSGQVPVAFVALKQRDTTIESNLQALCRDNLASYKIPRKFICLDDLPMNSTGKIDKKQLKQSSELHE